MSGNTLTATGRSAVGKASEGNNATMRSHMTRFDQAIDKNPFVLPTADEAFAMRDEERRQREELRNTQHGQKVWEKTVYSSTLTRTRAMVEAIVPDVDPAALAKARESRGLVSAAVAAIARDRRRERETVQEFVAKKRDMFLVQMSLDIKKEEMNKLSATSAAHEVALKKSEMLLEEDAIRFDAFLKKTDAEAHEAMKKAEGASKSKAEKVHELKKLRHSIGVLGVEKAKLRDALDEYRSYKAFLDGLTPKEWVEERLREQGAERDRRRLAALHSRVEAWKTLRVEKEEAIQAKVDADRKRALKLGQQPPKVDVQALVDASIPLCPVLADEPLPELSEEERTLPMYFTQPSQLAELFGQLEESNLFLIQHCQDAEAQLEELRLVHEETSASMESQTSALERDMAALQRALEVEEAKAAALRRRGGAEEDGAPAGVAGGEDGAILSNQTTPVVGGGLGHALALDALLPAMRVQIVHVFERCGFKANASSDTVGMLTQLEGCLESLLTATVLLHPDYVSHKERERERERRGRVRDARLSASAVENEVKQAKMLERASAPVQKRVGKPVMYRSVLPHKPAAVDAVDLEEEGRREEARFFS